MAAPILSAGPGNRANAAFRGPADAIAQISRLPKPPLSLVAGRTDAGVHARGQVAHVDLPAAVVGRASHNAVGVEAFMAATALEQFEFSLRAVLPRDLMLQVGSGRHEGFDARFSALWRRYRYRVCDDRTQLDPWRRRDTLVYSRPSTSTR